jgi:uncharacterized membrane protein YeaQ/YmgE (transglycosylase-associated protein family)
VALIVWLIVGAIAGFLASKVLSGHGVTNIVMQIVVAFVGALIVLFIFRAITHRRTIRA